MPRQILARFVAVWSFLFGLLALAPAEEAARLPALTAGWRMSISSSLDMRDNATGRECEAILAEDLAALARQGQVGFPGFIPIITDGKLLFRTCHGVVVCDLKAKEDRLEWWADTDGGFHRLMSDPSKQGILRQWFITYRGSGPPGVLFRNSLNGTVSTDGQRVYLVDDLAVPPPPDLAKRLKKADEMKRPNPLDARGALGELGHNCLKCYNLVSGKITWELSGRYDKSELKNTFILGPPLPVDGKLYVLNEKDKDVRLVCLQAKDDLKDRAPPPPDILWVQPIATASERLAYDPGRRMHAAAIAEANGVLLCLTNTGSLAAVDRASHKVIWRYAYQAQVGALPLCAGWSDAAIRICGDKVVFIAPDAPAVYCLKLADGSLIWKVDREDGLYLAGIHGERVIVAGATECRALRLEDGKPVWRRFTGPPAGRGVTAGSFLYLPQAATRLRDSGIDVLNLDTGAWVAWLSAAGNGVGNLAWAGDSLVSQTARDIAVYDSARLVSPPSLTRPLTAQELQDCWNDLLLPDNSRWRSSGWSFVAAPKQAVPFLRERVKPVARQDPQRVARWIAELQDPKFSVRQQATAELEKLEERAEPALQKALAGKLPLDAVRRLEALLDTVKRRPLSAEKRRVLRAIQIIDGIPTPEARTLLEKLATGDPASDITRAAGQHMGKTSK